MFNTDILFQFFKIPPLHLARGAYFCYAGRVPFRHPIYPVPVASGLGTHLTLDLAGCAKFGPDVEWIEEIDYTVDPGRYRAFLQAARRIWPENRFLPAPAQLLRDPAQAVRAGRCGGGFPHLRPRRPRPESLVNLFGIESPGQLQNRGSSIIPNGLGITNLPSGTCAAAHQYAAICALSVFAKP